MRTACGLLSLYLLTGYALAQQPPNVSAQSAVPTVTTQAPTPEAASTQAPTPQPAASGQSSSPATQPASTVTAIVAPESPKDLAEAKRDFDSGVKLKNSGKLEPAFEKFESAAALSPHSVDYVTAREITRQELVMDAITRGNKALQQQQQVVAMAEFRRALEFDPQNEFAKQRLGDSVWRVSKGDGKIHVADSSDDVFLAPNQSRHDFHFRGDARSLFTELGKEYEVAVIFDDSVKTTRTRFDIEDVKFATAMEAATRVTKTFWIALSPKQMLLLADTTENRRTYERMSIRTFYMTDLLSPQELADMVNTLRVVLDLRYIMQNPAESTITIRSTQPLLDAATQLLENMVAARPEVLLDVRVYQISQSLLRQLGANLPTQFTLFNISPQLIAGLGAGAQDLINQLIASGGINQANSQAIQALLAQLSQNSSSNALTNYVPFATFGGGLTLMGLHTSGVGATFNLNTSDVKNLEDVQLRAAQNTPATMLIGVRYPIVNATYSPIYNTPAIANVIGNGSYIAPVPSINYEDIGLKLKATPLIHSDKAVSLNLELQLRSLGSTNVNGIPIINNRQYSGSITVANGESSVIAGIIEESDQRMVNGWPFLARVPGLTYAGSQHDTNVNNTDLLVVITPHILRMPSQNTVAITLPTGH